MEQPDGAALRVFAAKTTLSIALEHATRVRSEPFEGSPSPGAEALAISESLKIFNDALGEGFITADVLRALVREAWVDALERHGREATGKYFSPLTADAGIPPTEQMLHRHL